MNRMQKYIKYVVTPNFLGGKYMDVCIFVILLIKQGGYLCYD